MDTSTISLGRRFWTVIFMKDKLTAGDKQQKRGGMRAERKEGQRRPQTKASWKALLHRHLDSARSPVFVAL